MADEPELARGASGEWVQYLQQLLEYAGHSPGTIDSDFSERTEEAVRAYQGAAGLTADGVVSAATWAALTGAQAGAGGATEGGGTAGGGTAGGGGGDDDVPQEFVAAGAPAQLSQWTDEQKNGYFQGQDSDDVGGDPAVGLEVAAISGDQGEGSLA